jgi:hypothetical protein
MFFPKAFLRLTSAGDRGSQQKEAEFYYSARWTHKRVLNTFGIAVVFSRENLILIVLDNFF